jgi:uncharacterized peroxidase-related enzyme
MARISPVKKEKASEEVSQLYEMIEKKMGRVANIFQLMSNSPAALKGYLQMSENASKTSLSPQLREKIALVVAQANNCHYCLSAHSAIAKMQGVSESDIILSRKGESKDNKERAILQLASRIVKNRAELTDLEVNEARKAGITDQEIVETLFVVMLNMFTNYFNHVAATEVDFPEAPSLN